MSLILPQNWNLIFFRDPKKKFTPARMKEVLRDRGLTVTGRKEPFMVRSNKGPILYVSITRGKFVETVIRGLVGQRRKHRTLLPGCDTEILIELSNVDEVLDEINTLIEVQCALQEATGGLMYMSWNHHFAGPDD
jgi:hypothetical protein